MDDKLVLRAFREEDLEFLDRLCTDPDALGQFGWTGFIDPLARRRRWEKDGYVGPEMTALAVVAGDGVLVGVVSYRAALRSRTAGACYEIGVALLPGHRGRGLGTAAQRLLVDYLFDYTTVNRLEALTDRQNYAEQKALERVGFQREGVLRGSYFHRGAWRDQVIYAVVRRDARPTAQE
ncbi:GNAT family N-acetyltransferase [Plantactinospora sp. WMMC1484]|uniref:GNAT family N-acetyltransferase n=1 Tax=Plantactinospora sp. WMMC1484 TaxID=3404122 RepID=UPI003BF5F1AC